MVNNLMNLYQDLKKRHNNCKVIIAQIEKENHNLSLENFFIKGEVTRLKKEREELIQLLIEESGYGDHDFWSSKAIKNE